MEEDGEVEEVEGIGGGGGGSMRFSFLSSSGASLWLLLARFLLLGWDMSRGAEDGQQRAMRGRKAEGKDEGRQ